MPTRGRVWAYYASDDGRTYAFQVDADYAAMSERGWTHPAARGTAVYPRGWTPRRAFGVDSLGNTRFAYVASVGAPLWTGAASTFRIYGSDETLHTVSVTVLVAERWSSRPG